MVDLRIVYFFKRMLFTLVDDKDKMRHPGIENNILGIEAVLPYIYSENMFAYFPFISEKKSTTGDSGLNYV